MAVVAAICGPGVPGNIKAQFAKGQLATVQKFDAVLLPPPDKNSPIITVSVKLDSDCMITAMILNSTNTDDAIGFLKALDLEGLAKWPREEMATCHYHPRLWSQATRRTPATASCSLHLGQTCTVGTKCG